MSGQTRRFAMLTDGFLFLLLSIFALFSTLLVLVGAQAYRNAVLNAGTHNEARILTNFVAYKARMNDREGGLRIEQTAAGDALVIRSAAEEAFFETWIYCWDGALRELTLADGEFAPEDGEALAPAKRIALARTGGLLTVEIEAPSGTIYDTCFALRCA